MSFIYSNTVLYTVTLANFILRGKFRLDVKLRLKSSCNSKNWADGRKYQTNVLIFMRHYKIRRQINVVTRHKLGRMLFHSDEDLTNFRR